jgi:L-seryl-tRNA(Ser) seleniumtransferase
VNKAYRSIPKVDVVLNEPVLQELQYLPELKKRAVGEEIDKIRASITSGGIDKSPDAAAVAERVAKTVSSIMDSGLKHVINAAGVIVYTNLGRAPLSSEAVDAMVSVAEGYSDLEFNLEQGSRGSRQNHIRPITRYCFGAEDALVVNNNAAAVMLVLSTLAKGKEVIVSRGELVEIGGSFRMPEVMAMSGAVMKEVGSTNKTKLSDYRNAISDNTALIIKVHRSNFSIVGFAEEVEIKELSGLCREMDIPLFVDMGSGIPFDLGFAGIHNEWTIPGCLEYSDVLSFSGDKVLGGPQAGIILGRSDLIENMAQNPLHRALRIDKLAIASLSSTLRLLAKGKHMEIPVLRMICEPIENVRERAEQLKGLIKKVKAEIIPVRAVVGGGSAPTQSFESFGVLVTTEKASNVHARLRKADPAVVARIEDDRLIFDMKTVDASQIEVLADKINEAFR